MGIDAFSHEWTHIQFYMFPPFCLIGRCLRKVINDEVEGVIIVPNWPNQILYSLLFQLIIQIPIILPSSRKLLSLPTSGNSIHPLWKNLNLLVCYISGNPNLSRDFRRQLLISTDSHGGEELQKDMTPTSGHLKYFVLRDTLIPYRRKRTMG